jgi:hypothetical protein
VNRGFRRFRRMLGSPAKVPPGLFQRQTDQWRRARGLVFIFYIGLCALSLSLIRSAEGLFYLQAADWLWPVEWMRGYPHGPWNGAALLVLTATGSMLAALRPDQRSARVLAALGIFLFDAFRNSYGKIGHTLHPWVLTALLLVFLPGGGWRHLVPSRAQRQHLLLVFFGAQALFLLTYTMSGIGKLLGAAWQIHLGQTHAFAPEALALHVAQRLLQTHDTTVCGNWLIHHPLAGWPLMWIMLYLHTFSFAVAFRPALHSVWAAGLILFHLGSWLLMGIAFFPSMVLLAALFLYSPFRPKPARPGVAWRSLPLFGRWLPPARPG